MGNVTKWFKEHRVQIREYLMEKNVNDMAPNSWWIQLMIVENISFESSESRKLLQSRDIIICEQENILNELVNTYLEFIQVEKYDLETIGNEVSFFDIFIKLNNICIINRKMY